MIHHATYARWDDGQRMLDDEKRFFSEAWQVPCLSILQEADTERILYGKPHKELPSRKRSQKGKYINVKKYRQMYHEEATGNS